MPDTDTTTPGGLYTAPPNGQHSLSTATGLLYKAMTHEIAANDEVRRTTVSALGNCDTSTLDLHQLNALVSSEARTYFFRKLLGSGFNAHPDLETMEEAVPALYQEARDVMAAAAPEEGFDDGVQLAYMVRRRQGARVFATLAEPVMPFLTGGAPQ